MHAALRAVGRGRLRSAALSPGDGKSPAGAMFFTIDMTKEIELHPKFFGPQLRDILKRKLKEEVHSSTP